MTSYSVSIDISEVLEAAQAQAKAVLNGATKAVNDTAILAMNDWKSKVYKASLWIGEKQPYMQSIQYKLTGSYSAEVWSDYALADEIDNGRPAKDLKKVLPTAKKARAVKTGKHAGMKYLIIPFRHNTPGQTALAKDMPPDIYQKAKVLSPSVLLPPGTKLPAKRLSATGHQVAQHSYQWGGRLPAGLAEKLKPHHVTDIYANMVRMNTSSGKQKSSAYMTFRTMGEWSNHWIVQARPGKYIIKGVAESAQKSLDTRIGAILEAAIK